MRFIPYSSFLLEQSSRWVHKSIEPTSAKFRDHTNYLTSAVSIAFVLSLALPVASILFSNVVIASALCASLIAVALLNALWVSKTGKLSSAKKSTSLFACALTSIAIVATGGWSSPYLVLCAALPFMVGFESKRAFLAFGVAIAAIIGTAIYFGSHLLAFVQSMELSTNTSVPHAAIAAALLFGLAFLTAQKFTQNLRNEQSRTLNAQTQLKLLSDNNSGLIAKHDASGATSFVGSNCRAITGTSAASLCNSGYLEKVHLQDRVVFLKALSEAAHTGHDQVCEIRMRYKGQGQQIWKTLEVACRPQRSSASGKMEIVSMATDVSERNTMRAELAAAEDEIAKATIAQRNFLATISHELRTPLNAIIGFSDIMHKELFGRLESEKHREYVGLIQKSGHHLLHVVNDMLDMTRIESGKYELNLSTFSLVSVADATLDMMQPLLEKNATRITCDVPANLPEIKADQNACQQILINLVSNAIKFSPDNGLVNISARQHGRSIRIQVKDNGIGIPASFMSSLGKPFEQADKNLNRKFEGSGLGVSVVMGLVELHGGKIDFTSTEGKGTTVTLTLPIHAAVARPMPANSEAGLVHLSAASRVRKTTSYDNSVDHKGEARARVSA